ncbi:Serine/threonine-protein kinase sepA OS=Dictyostelium discoideum GN=sepA PE=2 SV=1 [Rhizoctonia solani AG-1 IB]|uniref:Serine/threonine-protein kinase sepA n=1 Tax=Thanatephorus cucumeris (strain AG1-IB / isolate 7/3/14) TaxID=1108050 RepID=A0A0B7FN99_THACB|nr:Serine/threonine-protein kinase sepA OS=Dictyostelium discoideum GN=sepA PE=2 SV=1 [Rhizoctonia solani AG-1 IB]
MRTIFSFVQGQSLRNPATQLDRPGENLAVILCKNRWKPDRMAKKCDSWACTVEFSVVERKHHCRVCGGIFCRACSSKYTPLHLRNPPTTLQPLPIEPSFTGNIPDSMVNSRVCDRCYGLIYGSHNSVPSTVEHEPPVASESPIDNHSQLPLLAHPKPSGTSSGISSGYTRIRRPSAQQSSSTISSVQSTYFNHSIQSNSGGGGSLSSTPSALGVVSSNYPQRGVSSARRDLNNENALWLPSQLRNGSQPYYRSSWDPFNLDEDAVSFRSQLVSPTGTGNGEAGKSPDSPNASISPSGVGELVKSEQTIRGNELEDELPPVIISGAMSNSEILAKLGKHGCNEVTNDIDVTKSSDFPVVAGGFGDIYRGVLRDGTQVSIKCLRLMVDSGTTGRKHVKRAAHELYVWSKCSHPNVLEVYGVARYRDQIAMVSPWMGNGNLSQFLSRRPPVDRCTLCKQVADGAAYLHSQGIAHGDIKGVNVLVAQDYTLKLADFGNASLKEYSLKFTTTANALNISPRWTAPEVVFGDTGHSVEADVYALGMTILEVITGEVPYAGISDVTVFVKVMQNIQPMRPEQQIPSGNPQADFLWDLLMTCWTIIPRDRPSAASIGDQMKLITQEGLLSHDRWIPYSVLELSTS